MTDAMSGWGGYELSRRLSLPMRDREIIIDRTCARCGCEYEWGVHVAFFAGRVGLSSQQITSLTHGGACDPCWADERDRLLIEAADALHDAAGLGDDLWHRLARLFSQEQLLDLMMLAGWYHAISFTANGARVACEDGAPRFADVQPGRARKASLPAEFSAVFDESSAVGGGNTAAVTAAAGCPGPADGCRSSGSHQVRGPTRHRAPLPRRPAPGGQPRTAPATRHIISRRQAPARRTRPRCRRS